MLRMRISKRFAIAAALLIGAANVGRTAEPNAESASETALGKLAASMKPGEWAELKTGNLVEAHRARGASGAIFGYNEGAAWDPNSRQWLYCGGDHGDPARFVTYSAESNAWKIMPQPRWMRGGTTHGYDHNTIDAARGVFFYRPFSSKGVHRYDIAKDEWTSLPPIDTPEYLACCTGVAWFPELEGLVIANTAGGGPKGHILLYTEKDGKWTRIGDGLNMGIYQSFAEYSPRHKVVLFGGGNGSSDLYKLDADRKITTLKKAPLRLGTMQTNVTIDPVSNDFLVFGKDASFWVYDVAADAWTRQESKPPIFEPTRVRDNHVWHVTSAPVGTYGVNMFVKYYAVDPPQAWAYLYKHSDAKSARLIRSTEEKAQP